MMVLIPFVLLLAAAPRAEADVRIPVKPKNAVEKRYIASFEKEATQILSDEKKIKAGKYPGCKMVLGLADCFGIYLADSPPQSASGMMLKITLATALVMLDVKTGRSKRPWAVLQLVDGELNAFEAADTSRFLIHRLEPSASEEKDFQRRLSEEREVWGTTVSKLFAQAEGTLKKVESPAGLSAQDKQRWSEEWDFRWKRLQELKKRGVPTL